MSSPYFPRVGELLGKNRRVVFLGQDRCKLVCTQGHVSYLTYLSCRSVKHYDYGCPFCGHEENRKFKEEDAVRFLSESGN